MSESDEVLRRAQQAGEVAREVQETVKQAREGQVPVEQARQLERALQQIPEVQQATQQLGRAGQVARQAMDVAERALGAVGGVEALSEMAQQLAGQEPLDKVRFTFESSADPGGSWRVVELHAREGLSALYACTVDLANEHLGANVDELLGSSAQVLMAHEEGARRLCGVIHRVEHTGTRAGHLLARVHLVPALWALSQRKDQRIFQEKTVPEILEEVFTQALRPFERSFRIELNREYLPREYCVQYRETDLDFALRLMEEEGILFYFDHTGEKEELVLVEQNEQCPTCEAVRGSPITVKGPEAATASDESLRHFDYTQQLHTTSVVVRDFNWTHPDYDLTREARAEDALGRERESYEYPAPLLGPYDAGEKKYKYEPAQKQEELRRQALQVEGKRGHGVGYITGFTPGYMFELTGHGNAALDQWYLLTRVEHHGYAPEELTSDTHEQPKPGANRERYQNTFECIPLDVPFRAERRRTRARMAGLQTATVVGPASEEIHTDEHGRIKVQFHWDRKGQRDEKSSCFLRVAQVWAGIGWGFVFLPRIGMEVLVDFLEGDPDRPKVKANQTNSVDGNQSESVGGDQSSTVNKNRTRHVELDETITIKGKRTERVEKDVSVTLLAKRTEEVTGLEKLTFHGGRDITVISEEKLVVNGTRTETINGADSLTVNANKTDHVTGIYDITGDAKVKASQGDVSVTLEGGIDISGSGKPITMHNSSGEMKLDGGKITVTAQSELTLSCGGASISIKADGTISVSGPAGVTVSGGGGTVKASPAGVESSGGKISSSAGGINEISGAVVKIN